MLYIMWLYMLLVGYCIISALLQSVTDYHGVSGGYRSIMEVGHTGELQSVISDSACIATDSMQAGYLLPPIIGFPLNVNRHKVLSFRPSNKHIGTHIYELSDVKSTANSIYSASKIAIKEPVCSLHSLKNIHICHKQNMISNLRLCVLNFQGWWLIGINKKRKKKYSRYLNILNYLWKTLIIRVLLSYKWYLCDAVWSLLRGALMCLRRFFLLDVCVRLTASCMSLVK